MFLCEALAVVPPLTVRLLSRPVELKLIFAVSIFDALILDLKSLQDNLCLVSMSLLQRLKSSLRLERRCDVI